MTVTFDLLTLKLVRESRLRWGTFLGHARPVGSRVIRYVRDGWTDRQTDRQADKSNAYCPLPYGREHNNTEHRFALLA